MAKRIIVLDRVEGSPQSYHVLFWLNVPAGREFYYARTGAVSAWPGASGPENAAIEAGSVLEIKELVSMPDGYNQAQFAADLQTRWTDKQAALTADRTLYRYGSYWDGSSWTVVTH